jgi:hypothetical protein
MTEPPLGYHDCLWPVDTGCLDTTWWDGLTPEVRERSTAYASTTLRRLTGYRVGGCPVTVRPCKASCVDAMVPAYYSVYGQPWSPGINVQGAWINSCGCTTDCSCTELCEVVLPGPVGDVSQVKLNGGIMVADQYRVDGNRLVWVGDQSGCPWPACQDLAAADTEPNTFSVTYLNSYPVDGLGAYAAGVLAGEFAKACIGSNKCRLPASVTSISRAGVTYEIAAGAFPGGVTGIREVDSYIAIWNPEVLRQQSTVWSPDLRFPRVTR